MVYHLQSHKPGPAFSRLWRVSVPIGMKNLPFAGIISPLSSANWRFKHFLACELPPKSLQFPPFPKTDFFVRNIGSYPVCTL